MEKIFPLPNEALRPNPLLTADMADKLPKLYSTQDTSADEKMIQLRFIFTGQGATWLLAEYDATTGDAFGFVSMDGYRSNPDAEWGYFNVLELASLHVQRDDHDFVVIRDEFFRPMKFKKVRMRDEPREGDDYLPRPVPHAVIFDEDGVPHPNPEASE